MKIEIDQMKTRTNLMSLIELDLKSGVRSNIDLIKEGLVRCLEIKNNIYEYCGYKFEYKKKEGYFTITSPFPKGEVTYARKKENYGIGYEFWVSPEFDERNYIVKNIIL